MNPPASKLLSIDGLTVRRATTVAVEDVDLEIGEHSLFVLVGPSGCGKTSLLRAIAGFETAERGSIELAGRTLSGPGVSVPPEARQIGMVFQDGALFPHLNVWRNVLYGVERSPDAQEAARGALDLVGLGALGERFPDELSGGEQQRVALARALAPSPELLLLDEPFASLDAGLRARVREQVVAILEQARITAILVTHDQEEALSLADRMAVMVSGRILQVGGAEEVYSRPLSAEVARFLGCGQLMPCTIDGGRATFALGDVETAVADGRGWVLLRPERLRLRPGEGVGSRDLGCRVRERRFYGHDLIQIVELETGEQLEVRVLPGQDVPIGSEARLTLGEGPFHVFPD